MKGQFKARKYIVNENYFNSVNNDESAYILGFISADGGVFDNALTIGQSSDKGKELLEWIKSKLDSDHVLYYRPPKKETHNYCNVLTITSPKIVSDLNNFNIDEQKKYNYKFPDNLNLNLFKQFLRGYFDGDGCVGVYDEKGERNGKIYLSRYLKLSFYGTIDFIEKCKVLIPIKGHITYSKNKTHCEIIWTNKKAREFGKWLFENNNQLPLYVKSKKYFEYINEFNNTIPLNVRTSKKISQFNKNNEFIKTYDSAADANRILGISATSISSCISGKLKIAGGFIWRFKNVEEE